MSDHLDQSSHDVMPDHSHLVLVSIKYVVDQDLMDYPDTNYYQLGQPMYYVHWLMRGNRQ